MVTRENRQVFDLVVAGAAAICAVVADKGAVAEEEEVGVGIEKSAASITAEAVEMPSVASYGERKVSEIVYKRYVETAAAGSLPWQAAHPDWEGKTAWRASEARLGSKSQHVPSSKAFPSSKI